MHRKLTFVLYLFLLAGFMGLGGVVQAQEPIYEYLLDPDVETSTTIGDSIRWIVMDPTGSLGIDDVDTTSARLRSWDDVKRLDLGDQAVYAWFALRLSNPTERQIRTRLAHGISIDSIWIFEKIDGRTFLRDVNGSWVLPSHKAIKSSRNYTPMQLMPKTSSNLYVRYRVSSSSDLIGARFLQVNNHKVLIQYNLTYTVLQSLFAGWMALTFLMSILFFVLFKDRAFLYFAGLMLSFALYFLTGSDLLQRLFDISGRSFSIISRSSIAGQILFGGLFVASYVQLKVHLPTFRRWFLIYVLGVAAFHGFIAHILRFIRVSALAVAHISNSLSLIFIVLVIIPLILLIRKQQKESKIIFIAIGFLLIGAAYTTLAYMFMFTGVHTAVLVYQAGATIFSGVILYGLFEKFRDIRMAKQQAESLNALRSLMYANVSHEFRTPLSLVMGPIKQVEEQTTNAEHRNLLQLAYQNASRVLELIDRQLTISSIENGAEELSLDLLDIHRLIRETVQAFQPLAKSRSIHLAVDTPPRIPMIHADSEKIRIIVDNLLSNALKFTSEGGIVELTLVDHPDRVECSVRDTGVGISPQQLPRIFDRFYHSKNQHAKGSGIGLALVKDYVELHQGSISVSSVPGEGSTFTVILPKNVLSSDVPSTLLGSIPQETTSEFSNEWSELLTEKKPQLLIVEDQPELREFIKLTLTPEFDIISASNGKEGLEKALELVPDLIITDVMMPEMDGYALLSRLKNDSITCLIPILMLTAKASLESKIEGLNLGADGYLVKPFVAKELKATIRNILSQRSRIQAQLSKTIGPIDRHKPKDIQPLDRALLIKVVAYIAENLENPQLGATAIGEEIGLSKAHLNRKIKKITGLTIGKLINNYRLQEAVILLQTEANNIAEIADRVGFGSSAYFIKCFKEKFGTTPGAWQKQ